MDKRNITSTREIKGVSVANASRVSSSITFNILWVLPSLVVSNWATLKREIRHIHGNWETMTRSQLRTVLFDYIETFYNRARHQARLGHRTPADTYKTSLNAA